MLTPSLDIQKCFLIFLNLTYLSPLRGVELYLTSITPPRIGGMYVLNAYMTIDFSFVFLIFQHELNPFENMLSTLFIQYQTVSN